VLWCVRNCLTIIIIIITLDSSFVFTHLDVLLGDYIGMQVAVKVLKDKSMVQQFLTEAYVMTYVTVQCVCLISWLW